MRSALGLLADTDVAREILNGTWEPPDDIDRYTSLLLNSTCAAKNGCEMMI